jgi:hypothetical protein
MSVNRKRSNPGVMETVSGLIRPRVRAVETGKRLTEQLLETGWKYHATEEFPAAPRDFRKSFNLAA